MVKKNYFILLLALIFFAAYFLFGEVPQVSQKVIDGVEHIFNPSQPLKGRVRLHTKKAKEVPLSRIDPAGKFFLLAKDKNGNLWLAEAQNNKICRVNLCNGLMRSLGGRGSGPGEFKAILQMGILKDKLWIKD